MRTKELSKERLKTVLKDLIAPKQYKRSLSK